MRPVVVVVLHPVGDAFLGFLERLEPGPRQELVLQRLPEPLDLAQRLRMMRARPDVVDVVPRQLFLELRLAPPARVLPPVVRQQLPRHAILARRPPVGLHHVLGILAPVNSQARNEPGVIVDEPDQVGILAGDLADCDVALPELIRTGVFEPAVGQRLHPPLFLAGRDQSLRPAVPAHRPRAGLHEKHAPQNLRDPPRAATGVFLLQIPDLCGDRSRQPPLPPPPRLIAQSRFAMLLVLPRPRLDRLGRYPNFLCHQLARDTFFDA